jgi:NAD(P)-dependent dehydrogenase (short-subunit alcohol dehydrogenase family)
MAPISSLPFSLTDQTALVTGGATGIGFAVAQSLTALGARVIIAGRREKELAAAVQTLGPSAAYQVLDVAELAAIPAIVKGLRRQHGPIGILVNNAGINLKKPFAETNDEELIKILQTNVVGANSLTHALLPQLRESGLGSVVFISSMAAIFGLPRITAYSISKSALTGAVRSLAVELGEDNIRVNAVAPGWIETEMTRRAFEHDQPRKQKILNRTALGRMGEPADIGWAVAYLCSPAAKFITGTILTVDGGASIGF